MKAISLYQPYATLMAVGAKMYETRSWPTSYTGPIAIHSTASFPPVKQELCRVEPFRRVLLENGIYSWKDLPTGAIVATGYLDTCVAASELLSGKLSLPGVTMQERAFGDFGEYRYAFYIRDITPLPEPIPVKGMLRLWEWVDTR